MKNTTRIRRLAAAALVAGTFVGAGSLAAVAPASAAPGADGPVLQTVPQAEPPVVKDGPVIVVDPCLLLTHGCGPSHPDGPGDITTNPTPPPTQPPDDKPTDQPQDTSTHVNPDVVTARPHFTG